LSAVTSECFANESITEVGTGNGPIHRHDYFEAFDFV
jgi:hypothetical protein